MDFSFSQEEKTMLESVRGFARKEMMPKAHHYDSTMEYPWEVIKKAHENGYINLSLPEEYGGLGLTHLMQTAIAEELGYGCAGMATAMIGNDLSLGPLLVAGHKDQIQEFASMLVKDPKVGAYCVTEPSAGSDVAAIRTTAKKNGDHYILNGEKMWITNASTASWYFVLASLDPTLGAKSMIGFVIPSDLPGIEPGKKEVNMGQRCSDTRGITFKNVKIPEKYRLGKEGDGFKIAMAAFDHSRPYVAACAVGVAQCAFEHAVKYAQERKAFGKPIAEHQAVAFILADMAKDIEAARLLTLKSAWILDQGGRNTKYASFAKCFAGDMAVKVTQDAIQVFGGYGYNNEYPVEKLYRDAKIFQIYEGTQQIQRLIISRHVLTEMAI